MREEEQREVELESSEGKTGVIHPERLDKEEVHKGPEGKKIRRKNREYEVDDRNCFGLGGKLVDQKKAFSKETQISISSSSSS